MAKSIIPFGYDVEKLIERFHDNLDKTTGHRPEGTNCWPWTGNINKAGYGSLGIGTDTGVRAHRLAWELASGEPIPDRLEVCHVCDRVDCCRNDNAGTYEVRGVSYPRFGHLWLGTHKANMEDMVDKRRQLSWRETPHPQIVIPDNQIAVICARREAGESLRSIADDFHLSESHVSAIARGLVRQNAGNNGINPDVIAALSTAKGDRLPQTKIPDERIPIIREDYASGNWSQKQLAEREGVKQQTISRIITGKLRRSA